MNGRLWIAHCMIERARLRTEQPEGCPIDLLERYGRTLVPPLLCARGATGPAGTDDGGPDGVPLP